MNPATHGSEHINLTRWADAVLVCPATAATLNRFAAGLADDLPEARCSSRPTAPSRGLFAPAMNPAMWGHPATQASVAKLQSWGARFVAVGEGRTACGETGEGRLAEPDEIVAALEAALARPAKRLRVLVTAGGTAEPVDGVRVLTNTSTGATGAGIATHLARRGHEVVLLRARTALAADGPCREETFVSFAGLDDALRRLLGTGCFDAVIHAAAVSDYGVDSIESADGVVPAGVNGKIESGRAPLLRLRAPSQALRQRPARAESGVPLTVGRVQAHTHGARRSAKAEAAVRRLFAHSGADYVVHNDLTARVDANSFPSNIHQPDGTVAVHCANRAALGPAIEELLQSQVIHHKS